jgi:hypothetical protein
MARVEVDVSGPLFDGRAAAAVAAFAEDAKREVQQQVYAEVMTNLNASIKKPTPYYETQIAMSQGEGDYTVHDRGVIYGPWLEGTSERNRTTRFKGYASFRRAAQSIQGKVPQLVQAALARAIQRLGGGTP